MGFAAANLLFDLLEDKAGDNANGPFPVTMQIRESVAPPGARP
jgi:hypothetical protein